MVGCRAPRTKTETVTVRPKTGRNARRTVRMRGGGHVTGEGLAPGSRSVPRLESGFY